MVIYHTYDLWIRVNNDIFDVTVKPGHFVIAQLSVTDVLPLL